MQVWKCSDLIWWAFWPFHLTAEIFFCRCWLQVGEDVCPSVKNGGFVLVPLDMPVYCFLLFFSGESYHLFNQIEGFINHQKAFWTGNTPIRSLIEWFPLINNSALIQLEYLLIPEEKKIENQLKNGNLLLYKDLKIFNLFFFLFFFIFFYFQ